MTSVSIECKKRSIKFDRLIPQDHNPQLIKFVFSILDRPRSEINEYKEDILVLLILYVMLLMLDSSVQVNLNKYNSSFNCSNPFFDSNRSVIENMRHASAHGDVIITHDKEDI